MDTLVAFKLFYLCVIAGTAFLGGIIPLHLQQYFEKHSQKVQSYANCLSAGILLGASLIHLLVEAEDSATIHIDYPVAHLVCGLGFFLAFMLEKVFFSHSHSHGADHDKHHKEIELSESDSSPMVARPDHNSDHHDEDELQQEVQLNNDQDELILQPHDAIHHHHHPHVENSDAQKSAFILFAVCALESFVSGSAIGVASTRSAALILFLAVVTHIWAEAFAVTSAFLKYTRESKTIYKETALFSVVTPIGIILGLLLRNVFEGAVATLITSILIAFAAGIFLFIGAVEILVEEFIDLNNKKMKFFLVMVGFAFMAVVKVFFADEDV